eukprot:30832-Pelagococcus_subviridis.AAC.3
MSSFTSSSSPTGSCGAEAHDSPSQRASQSRVFKRCSRRAVARHREMPMCITFTPGKLCEYVSHASFTMSIAATDSSATATPDGPWVASPCMCNPPAPANVSSTFSVDGISAPSGDAVVARAARVHSDSSHLESTTAASPSSFAFAFALFFPEAAAGRLFFAPAASAPPLHVPFFALATIGTLMSSPIIGSARGDAAVDGAARFTPTVIFLFAGDVAAGSGAGSGSKNRTVGSGKSTHSSAPSS